MKEIRYSKDFEKRFKKRIANNQKLKSNFIERLALFEKGIKSAPINDHALTAKLKGLRAFSISSDIRVVYQETEDYILFLDIGTHNQVY